MIKWSNMTCASAGSDCWSVLEKWPALLLRWSWAVEFCLAAQCKDTITVTSLYPPEFLYKAEVKVQKKCFLLNYPTNACCLVLASSKCVLEGSPFCSQPWAGLFLEREAEAPIGNYFKLNSNHKCLFCDVLCCSWQCHFASAQEQSWHIPVSASREPGWSKRSESHEALAQALSHD